MNECFEKCGSVDKVIQVVEDTYYGCRNAGIISPKICFWNQKVKTNSEKSAINELLDNVKIQKYCDYFGIQSLNTTPSTLDYYIKKAKNYLFEIIDVELGILTDSWSEIKNLFDIDRISGVDKVFIITPYISNELANYDENFKKYALSINGDEKDKYKLINYVQQFKTKEDFIIGDDDMKLYILKKGVIGNFVRWLQEILEVEYGFENEYIGGWDGDFGSLTEKQVKAYQKEKELPVNGIIEMKTIINLINKSECPDYWMRKLQILMAYEK